MTENTSISTSCHRQGNKIMAAGAYSQRQIDKSLKPGQTHQKIIKDNLLSEFKVGDRLHTLCAPDSDDSNDAKPRVELQL